MPREWVVNTGINFTNENYSIQLLTDMRINKLETKIYSALIWGIPIDQNLLNQFTEIHLGAYYNSNKEFSPIFSIKWPDFVFSLSYNFLTGTQKRLPILENSFETNIAISINCHKRNNESEKVRCYTY
jgi:hypothetical protein